MGEELKNWQQFREEVWVMVKHRAARRGLSFQEAAAALAEVYSVLAIASMLYEGQPQRWDLVVNPNETEVVQ